VRGLLGHTACVFVFFISFSKAGFPQTLRSDSIISGIYNGSYAIGPCLVNIFFRNAVPHRKKLLLSFKCPFSYHSIDIFTVFQILFIFNFNANANKDVLTLFRLGFLGLLRTGGGEFSLVI